MPTHTPGLSMRPESERAPLGGCPVCGRELTGRQRVCSARCRAALSRKKSLEVRAERDARIRLLLRTVIETATEARELLT